MARGVDLESMSDEEARLLKDALAQHGVLVLEKAAPPEQEPHLFADLVRRLNPGAETIWRDQATNPWEKYKAANLGHAGTFQLPGCREVLVLGTGEIRDHFGLSCTLGGARGAFRPPGCRSDNRPVVGGSL